MSVDCYAPPEWLPRYRQPLAGTPALVTPPRQRAQRLAQLLIHILRMWLGAWLLAFSRSRRPFLVMHWAEGLLRVLAVRVRVQGVAPPAGWPVLLVANHISWLDSYVINSANGARFVAKSEVARWPLIGTIARRFGTLFLVRGSFRDAARTKDRVAHALRGGDAVAAFPEGTTTEGHTVQRFYPALLQAAIDAGVAVQPVTIRYRKPDGRPAPAAAFVGELTVWDSVKRLLREPALVAEVTFCPPFLAAEQTRRELATRAHAAIATVLGVGRLEPHPSHASLGVCASVPRRRLGAVEPTGSPKTADHRFGHRRNGLTTSMPANWRKSVSVV